MYVKVLKFLWKALLSILLDIVTPWLVVGVIKDKILCVEKDSINIQY